MRRKICFITGTRADYGILAPVMRRIKESPEAELQVIATNMHLSDLYGMTVHEIEADGFEVNEKITSLEEGGTSLAAVKSMAKETAGLAEAFQRLQPDLVVILGDRYEALSAASAAVTFNIPVAHLHGGETTEGAIDDKFRHAITQLSDLHFASTPQYAERIIKMGKDSSTVFHSGASGAEATEGEADEEKTAREFFDKTGIYPGEPFLILAFHPVTLSEDKGEKDLRNLLKALDETVKEGIKVLVTMPNSDPGTCDITRLIQEWAEKYPGSVKPVKSLGSKLFHHAMDNALAIAGNSSAALIEAPTHRLGAVNVGIRQKGRARGMTVIDVEGDSLKIKKALDQVMSMEMKAVLLGMSVAALNPYFKENSAQYIANKLIEFVNNKNLNTKDL